MEGEEKARGLLHYRKCFKCDNGGCRLCGVNQLVSGVYMWGKKKKVLPAPKCDCECKFCDVGSHCGLRPDCEHPTWRKGPATLRRVKSER